ncbi:hypothetical protein AOXY_G8553 [Acipenser oxyrinchus oxyrinchus]|uniref:Ig-like domain-containing protein n=1 Tax=Acipenser oxyrinchus oxyrinchus TaxID=40147 RepID=A0AAD8DJQ8_ACIOX|nr:hypothetical protein AOXY_G8553 [Acipenser oxyrinchus oxyrinchus]
MSSVWIILLLLVMVCLVMSTGNRCVLGIIRNSVTIPCEYENEGIIERKNISIEWRTSDSLIVHSFVHGEDKLDNQAPQYKNRTKIFKTEVEHGNFSLRLSDIIPKDMKEYKCFFHKEDSSTSKRVDTVCLNVAGHYTEPFISTSSHRENSEVDFTCTSSSGFPKPIDLAVTCAIENERLNETRTSASFYYNKQKPDNSQPSSNTGVIIGICVTLAIALGIAGFLIYRRIKMPQRQQPQDGPEATYSAVSTS